MTKNSEKTPPAKQATPSPINGVIPPADYQFRPGESGNYRGRPAAGLSWLEEVNRMAAWREADVRAVAKNKTASILQRAAAKDLLRWMSDRLTKAGHPIAGDSANRVLDRTIGRATQNIVLSRNDVEVPTEEELRKLGVAALRELLEKSMPTQRVLPALPLPNPAEVPGKEN